VFFIPADAETRDLTAGGFHAQAPDCAPYLGFPHGGSPACNRVLVSATGKTSVAVPPGRFLLYATSGPFSTLARCREKVTRGEVINVRAGRLETVDCTIHKLPTLLPPDTLSADLHVHGAASFDSSIPNVDRVLAFAAAGIDVIAATDHEVVGDYSEAMTALGLNGRIAVMNGLETTGHIPYLKVPGATIPRVIGHWNFWPLKYRPDLPRRGAPWDEQMEPGLLFETMGPAFASNVHVRQLNHPWAVAQFGRDLGFPRAIGMNLNEPLRANDDGSAQALWNRTPAGGKANNSYDTQEVMNGTPNELFLQYRAFWFYLNNLGEFHPGTANSDSHSLTDSVLGTPRNVVFTDTVPATFNQDAFNLAVKEGRSFGTNGPVIEATLEDSGTAAGGPSVTARTPSSSAQLHIVVRAAPWVPVSEVRVIVNGRVARTLTGLPVPAEPFGKADLLRLDTRIPLAELLTGGKDGWLVVEAGSPLPLVADLDGDGMPDTTDNNGDGVADKNDVEKGEASGPLKDPPVPTDPTDPLFHFSAVVPGGQPCAFTNPFVIDWAGDGFQAPGIRGVP